MYSLNRLYSSGYGGRYGFYSGGYDRYNGAFTTYHSYSDNSQHDSQIREPELAKLTAKIESGVITTVVLTERGLTDSQFRRIVVASTTKNAKVTEIDVSKNQLTSAAIQGLVDTLSENTTIRILNLAHNEIANESMGYFLQILKQNLTIICINLSDNPIVNSPSYFRLQFFLERNAQIQKEVEKSKNYSVVISESMRYLALPPLVGIVLEYYNEATIPQARVAITRVCYPGFPPQSETKEPKIAGSEELSDNSTIELFANQMQNIHAQYRDQSDKPELSKATAATADQERLVFSQSGNVVGRVVPPPAAGPVATNTEASQGCLIS